MRLQSFASLALPLFLAACGGLGLTGGSPDGGTDQDPCAKHGDYASCTADPACFADGCATGCNPTDVDFFGCHSIGTPVLEHSCPAIACAPACSQHTDLASCNADTACQSVTCPACGSNATTFEGCYPADAPIAPSCPQLACAQDDCTQHGDQTSCEADPACHAIFGYSPAQCATPDGNCLAFERCDGQPIACAPTPTPGPHSCPAAPECTGSYAPDYESGCETGCVRASLCPTN
jgi:hypothetical protein